jgi:multidrug transporter EmrE-like cation transporter
LAASVSQERRRVITWSIFALVLFSVGCSALAQISLKHGMAQPSVQIALTNGGLQPILYAVVANPFVLGGLFVYGLSAVVWLFVLARIDVSVAYPFVSLGFVVTMVLGCLLFGEAFTIRKILGTLVVMAGVYLVAAAR